MKLLFNEKQIILRALYEQLRHDRIDDEIWEGVANSETGYMADSSERENHMQLKRDIELTEKLIKKLKKDILSDIERNNSDV